MASSPLLDCRDGYEDFEIQVLVSFLLSYSILVSYATDASVRYKQSYSNFRLSTSVASQYACIFVSTDLVTSKRYCCYPSCSGGY